VATDLPLQPAGACSRGRRPYGERRGPDTVSTPLPQAAALLAEPNRRRLLDLLRDRGPADAHQLAASTGLHPTTVRSHLVRLVTGELVTAASQHHGRRGRPRTVYTAVPMKHDVVDPAYRELATALVDGLADTETGTAMAAAAGRAWGRRLAEADAVAGKTPREKVMSSMRALGFAPTAGADADEVLLEHCPLLDVAENHPSIVCTLHRELLNGVLVHSGASVKELLPFLPTGSCRISLTACP
jgi:predicted ArsR family transcriptional regulator